MSVYTATSYSQGAAVVSELGLFNACLTPIGAVGEVLKGIRIAIDTLARYGDSGENEGDGDPGAGNVTSSRARKTVFVAPVDQIEQDASINPSDTGTAGIKGNK